MNLPQQGFKKKYIKIPILFAKNWSALFFYPILYIFFATKMWLVNPRNNADEIPLGLGGNIIYDKTSDQIDHGYHKWKLQYNNTKQQQITITLLCFWCGFWCFLQLVLSIAPG